MNESGSTVRQQLRRRLTEGGMIVAPGIYDAYGARLVQKAGFGAALCATEQGPRGSGDASTAHQR